MKINKELLKGSTTMLVLNLLVEENMYGYQMIKALSKKSQNIFELKEGTLYPILHSLEEKINKFVLGRSGRKEKKILFYYKRGKKLFKR